MNEGAFVRLGIVDTIETQIASPILMVNCPNFPLQLLCIHKIGQFY